jgi:hypothetical protein
VAPIEVSVDREADLTVLTATGEVTAREILDVIAAYYAARPTKNVLWDLSAAALEHVTANEVKPLVQASQQYTAGRVGGKTAMVFSSVSAYGLGRLFDQLRQVRDTPVETMSFHDRAAAMAWLAGKE